MHIIGLCVLGVFLTARSAQSALPDDDERATREREKKRDGVNLDLLLDAFGVGNGCNAPSDVLVLHTDLD
jgi:hypothetical protein